MPLSKPFLAALVFFIVFGLSYVVIAGIDTVFGRRQKADYALVTKADWGELWPYPRHESGILRCSVNQHVTIKLGDIEWGLNGTAQSAGYPDSRELMAVVKKRFGDSELFEMLDLRGTSELIAAGLSLCK